MVARYGFGEFYEVGNAIKRGDLRTLDALMAQHQQAFIRLGVFLVFEHARPIAIRNMVKRIYKISGSNSRMSTAPVGIVLGFLEQDCDQSDIESVLVGLIFEGFIKGYLSHQKRMLVLSKADPFPISNIRK